MKIAIQGHPDRGKEVIQILESLGGINIIEYKGYEEDWWYYICSDDHCILHCDKEDLYEFKLYTLEEFKKECPFKVGDKVTFKDYNYPYTIKSFDICFNGDIVCEFEENRLYYSINRLKLYEK